VVNDYSARPRDFQERCVPYKARGGDDPIVYVIRRMAVSATAVSFRPRFTVVGPGANNLFNRHRDPHRCCRNPKSDRNRKTKKWAAEPWIKPRLAVDAQSGRTNKLRRRLKMPDYRMKVAPDTVAYADGEGHKLVVEFAIPGAPTESIDVKILQDSVHLLAPARDVEYVAALALSWPVKPDKAEASYDHGLLRIEVPFKDPMEDAVQVAVKTGAKTKAKTIENKSGKPVAK